MDIVCNYKVVYFEIAPACRRPYARFERGPASMPSNSSHKDATENQQTEKAPMFVAKSIREAILDEVFKPGDHLGEVELAAKFEVSRSPVREALLALDKEGTVAI